MGFFDFFKNDKNNAPETGLHLQNELIESIITAMNPYRLQEHNIIGIKIHLTNRPDRQVYDTLLGSAEFKRELDRNFQTNFFNMPSAWSFGYDWCEVLPTNISLLNNGMALEVFQKNNVITKNIRSAAITAIRGQLAEQTLTLQPTDTRYNIGRSKSPMLDTGRQHRNQIVITAPDEVGFDSNTGRYNLAVSRAHAYILYDAIHNQFCLYAYQGGLAMSNNSTKIFRGYEQIIRLEIKNHGEPLHHNDQIELGGLNGVLLEFTHNLNQPTNE